MLTRLAYGPRFQSARMRLVMSTTRAEHVWNTDQDSSNYEFVISGNFKIFPEFIGIIYRNFFNASALSSITNSSLKVNLWKKKCTPFVVLGMQSEETPRKIKNQKLVSSSRQCSSTQVGFGHGCLSKEQCDNTGASAILSWPGAIWFLPVPYQHWRNGAFVMLLTLRMRRQSWKGFHKMPFRNVPSTFRVAGRSVYLLTGTTLKEV